MGRLHVYSKVSKVGHSYTLHRVKFILFEINFIKSFAINFLRLNPLASVSKIKLNKKVEATCQMSLLLIMYHVQLAIRVEIPL